ncbi:MAG: hypothetical protein WED04_01445 [Promethearchaeati archaeon SRVP18_Atabeyarchaeia-1]
MSELPIDSLMTWYEEKTKELFSVFASDTGKRLGGIKQASRDIKLVLDEINSLKSTQEDENLKAALDRFIERVSSTLQSVTYPDDLTYSTVGDFLSRIERSVADIFDAGKRWIPRFRGRKYKSVIVDLDKHFRELTKETQDLSSAYKHYVHLEKVERVRDGIQGLSEMVTRIPILKAEIKEQEKKLQNARDLVSAGESRHKEYKSATGIDEKERIDRELERIRQSLGSQIDLLKKPMSKIRELSEAGTIHVKPEHITAIDLYYHDIIDALGSESEGCPAFRDLLTEMSRIMDSLGLEGSRQRRTLKRIESLLSSDLLQSSQKRVKELLQRREEVAKVYQPGEEKKILTDLEEAKKLLRDEETKTYRLNEELDQLSSKLKKNSKEISSEIAKITGKKIHISLNS